MYYNNGRYDGEWKNDKIEVPVMKINQEKKVKAKVKIHQVVL